MKTQPLGNVFVRNGNLYVRRDCWLYRCLRYLPFKSHIMVTACRIEYDTQSYVQVERTRTVLARIKANQQGAN